MPETSIVIKAEDRYSSVLKSLSSVTKSFDKNAEHLERTLHELSGEKSVLKAETDKARKALQEAQKRFAATGDAADGLAASLAGQEYEDYRRKLDAIVFGAVSYKDVGVRTDSGFAGIYGLAGSGNTVLVKAGDASGGIQGFALCSDITATAATMYQKELGSAIFVDGAIV